jgi:hypothetical protein
MCFAKLAIASVAGGLHRWRTSVALHRSDGPFDPTAVQRTSRSSKYRELRVQLSVCSLPTGDSTLASMTPAINTQKADAGGWAFTNRK